MRSGYDANIAKSHEPLTITAYDIAGFLERCNRPRAAAYVDDLGGNYDRALQTINELRTQLNEALVRLAKYEPPAGPKFGEPPRSYRSRCE
jgi:hypothetical protein